jgi:hypothetical protein
LTLADFGKMSSRQQIIRLFLNIETAPYSRAHFSIFGNSIDIIFSDHFLSLEKSQRNHHLSAPVFVTAAFFSFVFKSLIPRRHKHKAPK